MYERVLALSAVILAGFGAGCEATGSGRAGPAGAEGVVHMQSTTQGGEAPAGAAAEGPEGGSEAAEPAAEGGEAEVGAAEEAGLEGSEAGDAGTLAAKAPEGYGEIVPPDGIPAEEDLVMHALAGYEVVAVYAKPSMDAKKLGFLRIGQRAKVTKKITGEGCPKGFHGLPQGGYACASKGLVVSDSPPFLKHGPPPPQLDAPSPYEWAYVKKWNSPMWWRVPSGDELARASEERAKLEAERTGVPLPSDAPVPAPQASEHPGSEGGAEQSAELPPPPAPIEPEPGSESPPESPPEPVPAPTADDPPPEEEPVASSLPLNPAHPYLEKGFFVSLASKVTESGKSYWRTARGGYVSVNDAWKYEPKDFVGQPLEEDMTFPVGFVMAKKGATTFELSEDGKLVAKGKLEKRDFVDLTEEMEVKGKSYMMTTEGLLIRKDKLRLASLQSPPKGIEPWERWIDVDIASQMLVAYEGTRPVFVTLVSTGRKGTEEEPFETPTGRWRIYSKQVTSNMDGATATDGNYAIQDVPWVMYFEGSYALHGAFWHRSFGHVRSHGCVNLGPSDARWLFMWTTPFLPPDWHGVSATDESPGSTVVVRNSDA